MNDLGPFELNRIYHTECLTAMKQMPDGCVDMVLTDPPYGVAYKTGYRKQKWHTFCTEIKNDSDMSWVEPCAVDISRIMKENSALYWFSNHNAIDIVKPILCERLTYKNTITWIKNNWTAGDLEAAYGKQTELIVYLNKGRREINGRRDTDVWYYDRVAGEQQYHQNEKPIDLIINIILKSSNPGDTILDPFMGSGTMAVACIKTDRNFIGFEIDESYYNIACKRIEAEQAQLKLEF